MGNVAKETKALYCTDYNNVNAAARWMESVTLTLGDPVFFLQEVSRRHSRSATSHLPEVQGVRWRSHR